MIVLFVLGPPGVGKTTAVRPMLKVDRLVSKPKWTIAGHIVAAGHYTGTTFDGADTVPYNGVRPALEYWKENLQSAQLTILDGDRFSHDKVKQWFTPLVERVAAVYLNASNEVLTARRNRRGSNQNPSWMKGRETKARRFFETFDDSLIVSTMANPYVTEDISQFVGGIRRSSCDHKFVDSKSCLKCGWTPPPIPEPTKPPGDFEFCEAPQPGRLGWQCTYARNHKGKHSFEVS